MSLSEGLRWFGIQRNISIIAISALRASYDSIHCCLSRQQQQQQQQEQQEQQEQQQQQQQKLDKQFIKKASDLQKGPRTLSFLSLSLFLSLSGFSEETR